MHIQWFPGHMTKALRMMRENVKLVDCFIYVLDARAVFSCINPTFNELIGNKPVLYVINKYDLIDKRYGDAIKAEFDKRKYVYVTADSKSGSNTKSIIAALKKMNEERIARYLAKGVNMTVRAMVIGIPNTGKSTLINSLVGGKRTVTGNKPGVTKGKQWVVLDKDLVLLDTPGTLCPAFDNQTIGKHLAFLGSINDAIIDTEELALELIGFMATNHADEMCKRYGMDTLEEKPIDVAKQIARVRGFVLKGGEFDLDRTYIAVIDDFRKTRIGRIALEY